MTDKEPEVWLVGSPPGSKAKPLNINWSELVTPEDREGMVAAMTPMQRKYLLGEWKGEGE